MIRLSRIRVVGGEEEITLPESAMRMLVDILAHRAEGETIKEENMNERRTVLDELSAQAQELKMGY